MSSAKVAFNVIVRPLPFLTVSILPGPNVG